jgi:hypothetical protein
VSGCALKDGRASRPISSSWPSASAPTAPIWPKPRAWTVNRGIRRRRPMRTSDPVDLRGRRMHRAPGQSAYGLVAPIWDMAKVAADHSRRRGRPIRARCCRTQAEGHGRRLFSAGDFMPAAPDLRGHRAARRRARRLQAPRPAKDDKLVGACSTAMRRRRLVSSSSAQGRDRRRAMRETLMFGPGQGGPSRAWTLRRPLRPCPMMRKSAAATASARAQIVKPPSPKGPDHARRGARAHQGLRLLRLLHGLVEQLLALTLGDGYSGRSGPTDVPLHRPRP